MAESVGPTPGETAAEEAGSNFYKHELVTPEPPVVKSEADYVQDQHLAEAAAYIEKPTQDDRLEGLAEAGKEVKHSESVAKGQETRGNTAAAERWQAKAQETRDQAAAESEARKAVANAESSAFIRGAENAKRQEGYETDLNVARATAYGEKPQFEQARALEKSGDLTPEQQQRAEALRAAASVAGEAAATGERESQAAVEAARVKAEEAITERLVAVSTQIADLTRAKDGAIPSIDARDDRPATLKMISDLYKSLGVDATATPLDTVTKGARLSGNKTVSIYRESNNADYRGMVFVERHDWATGKLLYVDVVKAPKPADAGKRELKKWRDGVDAQLQLARAAHHEPHRPSMSDRLTGYSDGGEGGPEAAIQRSAGINRTETPKKASKGPSHRGEKRPWWKGTGN